MAAAAPPPHASASPWSYSRLQALVADEQLPAMVVDLDIFDANVRRLAAFCSGSGKTLRLATKSVRVPELMARCAELCPSVFRGLMCFSATEARALRLHLGDRSPLAADILVAYPTVQRAEIRAVAELMSRDEGCTVHLMVDCPEHVELCSRLWAEACDDLGLPRDGPGRPTLSLCIDVDMSYRRWSGLLHLGVHRSSCRGIEGVAWLCSAIAAQPGVRLSGVMGYEAQVAGLPDLPLPSGGFWLFQWLFAKLLSWFKGVSMADVCKQRQQISQFLVANGHSVAFFNGGGTGNAAQAAADPSLTEITCGSGLLQSSIFDRFKSSVCEPAFCFGLRVTRSCQPGVVTCQSGGFVASGPAGEGAVPQPFLPRGLTTFADEGMGEVQSPLQTNGADVRVGQAVFFRPAKAGEVAERFPEYLLTRGQTGIVGRSRTYRGLGWAFF